MAGRGAAALAVGEQPAARAGVVTGAETLDGGVASPLVRFLATLWTAVASPRGTGQAAGGSAASTAAATGGGYGTAAAADGMSAAADGPGTAARGVVRGRGVFLGAGRRSRLVRLPVHARSAAANRQCCGGSTGCDDVQNPTATLGGSGTAAVAVGAPAAGCRPAATGGVTAASCGGVGRGVGGRELSIGMGMRPPPAGPVTTVTAVRTAALGTSRAASGGRAAEGAPTAGGGVAVVAGSSAAATQVGSVAAGAGGVCLGGGGRGGRLERGWRLPLVGPPAAAKRCATSSHACGEATAARRQSDTDGGGRRRRGWGGGWRRTACGGSAFCRGCRGRLCRCRGCASGGAAWRKVVPPCHAPHSHRRCHR